MDNSCKLGMALHVTVVATVLLATAGHVTADVLVYSITTHEIEATFRDDASTFGEQIPFDGIKGMLVQAYPADGCNPIDPPPSPYPDTFLKRWFVLIQRYGCKFEDKVRNAQNAGYHLAIVHNVNSSDIQPMGADRPSGIHIPSIFVGGDAGILLRENYKYTDGYYILINGDIPFITPHLLLIFSVLVGLCFLFMVLFIIVKYFKERRRQRRHRLPRSSLKEIPIHKFKKNDPYEMCAICLEEYIENDKLRVLPCSHAYHSKCIDPWLTKNRRVCPVCKRKVFARGEVNTDTESDTEDETAPLVRGSQRRASQGGAFQQENGGRRSRPGYGSTTDRNDNSSNQAGSSASSSDTSSIRSIRSLTRIFTERGPRVQNLIAEPSINTSGSVDVVTHPQVEEATPRNLSC